MQTTEKTKTFWKVMEPSGRLLRPFEVCERTGLSRSQVYELIRREEFPPFIKLSPGTSAMPQAWLDEFISQKARAAIAGKAADPAAATP